MASQDELKLSNYKYIIDKVLIGKVNGKTYDVLYNEYKTEGGWLAKSSFTRKVRDLCETAQRDGIKLCRDSDCGLYIAANLEEWEAYKKSEHSRANNIIMNIAYCEKKNVPQLVREWFLTSKKQIEIQDSQLKIFQEVQSEGM